MGGKRAKAFVLIAFLISVLLLGAGFLTHARADDSETNPTVKTSGGNDAPLVIPIYPDFKKDESKLPEGADLRDSYIVMEDGSVLSVADWVLGSLRKSNLGAGMSDYDNRLFLGQVARRMAGMSEDQINRSITHSGPPIPFIQGGEAKAAPVQALQVILGLFMAGMPENYSPATSGGAFSPSARTEGGAAILFEEQFSEALRQSAGELWESGTMQTMLQDYKKKMEKSPSPRLDAGTPKKQ